MRNQNFTQRSLQKSAQKWLTLLAGVAIVPVFAACAPNTPTAQTTIAPTTAESPGVTPGAATPAPGTVAENNAENNSVVDVAASQQSLSTLTTVIREAGLTETLNQQGPYTLFAPSDQAFAAIPEATRQRLLQPENRETLRQILTYHVVPGALTANQLRSGQVQTVAGESVNVQVDQAGNQVRVNDATVTQPNLQASNGVVHIVDQVILPPNLNL